MTALVPPAKIAPTRQLVKSIDVLRRCYGDHAGTSGPTNRSRKGISELQSTELVDSAEISECLVLSLNCFRAAVSLRSQCGAISIIVARSNSRMYVTVTSRSRGAATRPVLHDPRCQSDLVSGRLTSPCWSGTRGESSNLCASLTLSSAVLRFAR